jgi:hypothetical protein
MTLPKKFIGKTELFDDWLVVKLDNGDFEVLYPDPYNNGKMRKVQADFDAARVSSEFQVLTVLEA